jgi:hypothetical protein
MKRYFIIAFCIGLLLVVIGAATGTYEVLGVGCGITCLVSFVWWRESRSDSSILGSSESNSNKVSEGLKEHIKSIVNHAKCQPFGTVLNITQYGEDLYVCDKGNFKVLVNMDPLLTLAKCEEHVKIINKAVTHGIPLITYKVCHVYFSGRYYMVYILNKTDRVLSKHMVDENVKEQLSNITQRLFELEMYCQIKSLDDIEYIRNDDGTISLVLSRVDTLRHDDEYDYRHEQYTNIVPSEEIDDQLP